MAIQKKKPTTEPVEIRTNPVVKPTLLAKLNACFSNWWPTAPTDTGQKDTNKLAEIRTDLAATRTMMAADRTLMAWVRTALSMISFGFTIYKILEGLQKAGNQVTIKASPENVGLFLIGLGTISMAMGTIEYWHNLKELRQLQNFRILRPAFVTAVIISVTGLVMFISVITKIL
jgi:putative membrane protein